MNGNAIPILLPELIKITEAVEKLDPSSCVWLTPVEEKVRKPAKKSTTKYFDLTVKTRKGEYLLRFRRYTYTTGHVIDDIHLSNKTDRFAFATSFKGIREQKAVLRNLLRTQFATVADNKQTADSWLNQIETNEVA